MPDLILLGTAAVLGFVHALEIDHMLAVTAFVSRRPTLVTAARFGLRWGVGHSVAVLAGGGILLATGLRWSPRYDRVGEGAVGLMLIGIGLWSLRSTRNLHLHPPPEHGDHVHVHTHPRSHHPGEGANPHAPHHNLGEAANHHTHPHQPGEKQQPHDHSHPQAQSITLVGLLHGLAGTSAVVALVPVTLVDRLEVGVGYLLAFGAGVTAAMTLFAAVAALAMRRTANRSLRWGRMISMGVGAAGVVIGIWWVERSLMG